MKTATILLILSCALYKMLLEMLRQLIIVNNLATDAHSYRSAANL